MTQSHTESLNEAVNNLNEDVDDQDHNIYLRILPSPLAGKLSNILSTLQTLPGLSNTIGIHDALKIK